MNHIWFDVSLLTDAALVCSTALLKLSAFQRFTCDANAEVSFEFYFLKMFVNLLFESRAVV